MLDGFSFEAIMVLTLINKLHKILVHEKNKIAYS